MPNRIIREGILTSDKVDQLDPSAEVFFRRLLSKVDDYGRYDARLSVLRASLYPLRIDRVKDADVAKWLSDCQRAGLLILYAHEGKPYLEVCNTGWKARSESKFPKPNTPASNCSQAQTSARLDVDVVVDVVVDDKEDKSSLSPAGAPDCPHAEILALYHEMLPANPRMKVWNGDRAASLRARWREDQKRQSLDYWRRFFAKVAKSPFLTGQVDGRNGRPFLPGLDWMVKASNFAKIIEGRYDGGASA